MTSVTINSDSNEASWEYRLSWLLWLASAGSLVFVQIGSSVPATIFLCVAILNCALFPHRAYLAVTQNFVPWVMVLFGALSLFWSLAPMQTARAVPQVAITVLATIMFAQALPARAFIVIIMYSHLASIIANFYITGGVFGSKNTFALQLGITLLSSLWVLLDSQQPKYARLVALLTLSAAPSLLLTAGSEGALLTTPLALLSSMVVFLMRPLHRSVRVLLIWLGIFVVILALNVTLLAFDRPFEGLLSFIGKDTSLTGRTVLWSYAASIIADHPWGGVGLQAFWVQDNMDAVRFWEMNYITAHGGFHFHDLWLETGVELGLIGILIAAGYVIIVFFSVWRWALRDPRPESCFFVGFVTFILVRTVGEVELFGQFNLPPMMFLAAYYYAHHELSRFKT